MGGLAGAIEPVVREFVIAEFMIQIDLQPTFTLHDQLRTWSRTHEASWRAACNEARERLHEAGIRFEGGRDLPLALTALLLRPEDEARLRVATERLHQIIERVLDLLLNSPPTYSPKSRPKHCNIVPFRLILRWTIMPPFGQILLWMACWRSSVARVACRR